MEVLWKPYGTTPEQHRTFPVAALVWGLRVAYAFADQSGRGQPHFQTLRVSGRIGGRASVLECGCPLPLSSPGEG
jgi:hypothetical protein